MWTNAATISSRICSPENTKSFAKASCSTGILPVGPAGVSPAYQNLEAPGRMRSPDRQDACAPLTAFMPQITINNEYSARARGGGFTSKPHHKERKTKSNNAVEGSRNDRAPRLARWFQGRCRSRQKSRLLFAQRRLWQTPHRSLWILRLDAGRV